MTEQQARRKLRIAARNMHRTRSLAVAFQTEIWNGIESLAVAGGRGSMKKLAVELGISEQQVNDLRYGRRGVSDPVMRKIETL